MHHSFHPTARYKEEKIMKSFKRYIQALWYDQPNEWCVFSEEKRSGTCEIPDNLTQKVSRIKVAPSSDCVF